MTNEIPEEHRLQCTTCGEIIDLRDLAQVLSHGVWNWETQRHECITSRMDVILNSARKVDEAIEWTNGKPTYLN